VFVAVTEGASRIRRMRGGLPGNVAWAVSGDELADARLVGLSMRYALEVASRRRLERRVAALAPQAEVGLVASATAHEIGNPLTSLLTNLELLWTQTASPDGLPDRSALHAAVVDALEGARHVARVAKDLGRASGRAGRITAVDVRGVLETAQRLLTASLEGVEVRFQGPRACYARADETRLCQVFLNLLQNAAHAVQGASNPRIDLEVTNDDPVVVRVRDNGPGVPEALAPRVFDAWVTGKAQGTGLGLALSRRYLAEMGATIELIRGTTRGTTFELHLVPGRPPSSVPPTLVPDASRGRARVLIVDDTPLVGRAFERALSARHDVVLATNRADARRELGRSWFDVLFVDLQLGRESGLDLYQDLVGASPDQAERFVAIGGAVDQEQMAFLDKHGIRFVQKPIGADELRTVVMECVGRDG
jgi:signal transduction histidine kinase